MLNIPGERRSAGDGFLNIKFLHSSYSTLTVPILCHVEYVLCLKINMLIPISLLCHNIHISC